MKKSYTDIMALEKRYRANLINSLSGFKALQLVGTKSVHGEENLSLINSAHHLGAHPPLMGYIQRPHTVERQTYENIIATKRYTFSNVLRGYEMKAHQTSARYPKEVSEFEACGIGVTQTEHEVPYVSDATIVTELKYLNSYEIKENNTILVVGEIENIWLAEDLILEDGTIDLCAANSTAGVGLNGYVKCKELKRYGYAKPDKELQEI